MLLLVVRGLFVACALSGFGAALFALTMPIARDVNSRLHASIERQVGKIIAVADAAPDSCRRLARRAASPSRRGAGGTARCCASCRPALLYPRYDLGQRACRHRASSGDAAFGRTCGTHRNGLRRGVAIESRLVRSVDRDRRRQSLSPDAGVLRTGRGEGQEGSRAQHWHRNCSRSLRGVCRKLAQQPRAWNAYAVGIRPDGET